MKNKSWFIYCITNAINGKIYIGQSADCPRRWQAHKRDSAKENPISVISKAIKKYGIQNFSFEVIAYCKSWENANETETLLVKQYNSLVPNGYNVSNGGYNAPRSEEWKKSLSAWHASLSPEEKAERSEKLRLATINQINTKGHPAHGTKRTEEQRKTLSFAQQNRDNNYTIEMRKRMSDAHKGKKQPNETIQKRVLSINLTVKERQEKLTASGELKCNAPNCEIKGVNNYLFINNIRYCQKHANRFNRLGSFELLPFIVHNKGKKISEETRVKLVGRVPHNKIRFTKEQINAIVLDIRPAKLIAKDFNVSKNTILRIKKSNTKNT
jgi:group I intron endonuclease